MKQNKYLLNLANSKEKTYWITPSLKMKWNFGIFHEICLTQKPIDNGGSMNWIVDSFFFKSEKVVR